jgi:hypothetical protein
MECIGSAAVGAMLDEAPVSVVGTMLPEVPVSEETAAPESVEGGASERIEEEEADVSVGGICGDCSVDEQALRRMSPRIGTVRRRCFMGEEKEMKSSINE